MGTNNPSDEQLDLVTERIISLASSLYPYVAMDANSYFDEAGFDDEMNAQLQAKLTEYIQNAEEVVPSLEEHPQPRRMARYLLENVDYDEVLSKPLEGALLSGAKVNVVAVKPAGGGGGGGGTILGMPRNVVLGAALVLLLLLICVAVFYLLGMASGGSAAAATAGAGRHGGVGAGAGGGGGGGARAGKGGRARNRSAAAPPLTTRRI